MKVELERVPVYNINPELRPRVKKYASVEAATQRPGTVLAWDSEINEWVEATNA